MLFYIWISKSSFVDKKNNRNLYSANNNKLLWERKMQQVVSFFFFIQTFYDLVNTINYISIMNSLTHLILYIIVLLVNYGKLTRDTDYSIITEKFFNFIRNLYFISIHILTVKCCKVFWLPTFWLFFQTI